MAQDATIRRAPRTFRARSPRSAQRLAVSARGETTAAHSFGERLLARRHELGMKQAELADAIEMSRPAVSTYESEQVEPGIDVVTLLAQALKVSPSWLGFGDGAKIAMSQVNYDEVKKKFVSGSSWNLNQDWLREKFGKDSDKINILSVPSASENFEEGDLALVVVGEKPGPKHDEFVLVLDNEVVIKYVLQQRDGDYRLFGPELKSHETVKEKDVVVYGRVVGAIRAY